MTDQGDPMTDHQRDPAAVRCPVHNMPDCSPLLNGCSIPNRLHAAWAAGVAQAPADAAREALADAVVVLARVEALADEFERDAADVGDRLSWDDGWRAAHRKVVEQLRAALSATAPDAGQRDAQERAEADLTDEQVADVLRYADLRCQGAHPTRWQSVTEQRVSCLDCKAAAVRQIRADRQAGTP